MSNTNGLFTSRDVAGSADPDSVFFIRKGDPVIIDDLVANNIACDDIDLNGGLLTTTSGGTILTLNGNPVGGGQVDTITGTAPITVTGTAIDPVISLANSGVVPATYTVASVTVDAKGLITNASSGVIPPNDDWSNFPAQTNVNMNNFKLTSLATPTANTDATTKLYVDTLDGANVKLTGNQTVGGIKTFTSLPESSVVPTTANQLVNKNYVDTIPAPATPTLTQVLTAGNSAGTSQINMNNNKIIGLDTPTLATDAVTKGYTDGLDAQNVKLTGDQTIAGIKAFSSIPECIPMPTKNDQLANKQYVDSVAGTPTLSQVLTAGNTASTDINMNGFDISSVNDITFSGLIPTITATNVLGNLTIASANTMNLLTTGDMTLASSGVMSIGGATYTTLENLRIDNSVITKETFGSPDLQFSNVQSVSNTAGTLTFGATTNGSITATMAGTGAVSLFQSTVGGINNPLLKLQTTTTTPVGVAMELYHNKTGVIGDRTGIISFDGNDTAGTKVTYSRIRGDIRDPTPGTTDGEFLFEVQNNGAITTALTVNNIGTKPVAIIDGTNSTGTPGQVLSSTGTGLQWVASGGGGGYAGTVETLGTSGLMSSLVENTQISGVGTYTLQPGTTPNQRKMVTLLPSLLKAMRPLFPGVGGQFIGSINACVYDPILDVFYFGGSFNSTPDGVARARIASFSPTTGLFYSLGTGLTGASVVSALFLDNTIQRLYVAGNFTSAGGVTGATRFARYDITGVGTGTWGTLSANFPSNGAVFAIARDATNFYIGGTFTGFNTPFANSNCIARYNIATGVYSAIGSGISTSATIGGVTIAVNSLFEDGGRLYVGGSFVNGGGVLNTTNICYWNGTSYVTMGRGCPFDTVTCITKYDNEIVIGGTFTSVLQSTGATLVANRIASWNIATNVWKPLGNSLANTVFDLKTIGGELYAVGSMSQTIGIQDGTDMQRIARWDAGAGKWRTFGGVNGQVNVIVQYGSELAVFGNFNRSFTFESFGQNQNACVITPANFTIINGTTPGLITHNGYVLDFYQASGQNTVNSMEFVWNATESKWINTRVAETLPNT